MTNSCLSGHGQDYKTLRSSHMSLSLYWDPHRLLERQIYILFSKESETCILSASKTEICIVSARETETCILILYLSLSFVFEVLIS